MIRCTLINGFESGGHLINCNQSKNHFFNTDNKGWGYFTVIFKREREKIKWIKKDMIFRMDGVFGLSYLAS